MINLMKSLKCVGLWEQEHPYSLCRPSTFLFIALLFLTVHICLAQFVYAFRSESLLEIADDLGSLIGTVAFIIKLCDLFICREQFFKLVKNLEDAFDEGMSIGKHTDILLNYHRKATRYFNLYFGLWASITVYAVIFPVIIYEIKLALGYSNLPSIQAVFKAELFYTSGIANRLLIDYIIISICSAIVILSVVPFDCYLGCVCLYIIPHIKIIKEDLKNISYVTDKGRDVRRRNKQLRSEVYVEERLLQFIKYHQRVISFVDQLEEVCNRQMMVRFICTTFLLCLTIFQATHDIHDMDKTFMYASGSIGVFIQLFISTYYGQLLFNEASELEFAVYNIAWFDKSVKFKRLIPFILMRVQKPLGVTAFGYCPVSMDVLASVLKTVISYITLLKQVTENVE